MREIPDPNPPKEPKAPKAPKPPKEPSFARDWVKGVWSTVFRTGGLVVHFSSLVAASVMVLVIILDAFDPKYQFYGVYWTLALASLVYVILSALVWASFGIRLHYRKEKAKWERAQIRASKTKLDPITLDRWSRDPKDFKTAKPHYLNPSVPSTGTTNRLVIQGGGVGHHLSDSWNETTITEYKL